MCRPKTIYYCVVLVVCPFYSDSSQHTLHLLHLAIRFDYYGRAFDTQIRKKYSAFQLSVNVEQTLVIANILTICLLSDGGWWVNTDDSNDHCHFHLVDWTEFCVFVVLQHMWLIAFPVLENLAKNRHVSLSRWGSPFWDVINFTTFEVSLRNHSQVRGSMAEFRLVLNVAGPWRCGNICPCRNSKLVRHKLQAGANTIELIRAMNKNRIQINVCVGFSEWYILNQMMNALNNRDFSCQK